MLASQAGYTLPELVSVLAILGTVLAALSTMFVGGLRSETDMNQRFQAQQEVRLALSKLRREARCASDVTSVPAGTTAATGTFSGSSNVSFTLGGYCTAAGATQVTWCAVALGPQRYGLFRQVGGGCDASGVMQADYLSTNALFSSDVVVLTKHRLRVFLQADAEPKSPHGTYTLDDTITLRNSGRFGARIGFDKLDTNLNVGLTQTLTVKLDTDVGGGYNPASGEHVDVVLSNAIGAKYTNVGGTCMSAGANVTNGQCTVTFSSLYAGTVLAHATSTLTVDGRSVTVQTNSGPPNSSDAVTTFITPA